MAKASQGSQNPTSISRQPHLPGGAKVNRVPLVTPVPEPSSRGRGSAGRGVAAKANMTPTAQGRPVPQAFKNNLTRRIK